MSMITNFIPLSSRVAHSSVCFPCSVSLSFLQFLSLIGILELTLIYIYIYIYVYIYTHTYIHTYTCIMDGGRCSAVQSSAAHCWAAQCWAEQSSAEQRGAERIGPPRIAASFGLCIVALLIVVLLNLFTSYRGKRVRRRIEALSEHKQTEHPNNNNTHIQFIMIMCQLCFRT